MTSKEFLNHLKTLPDDDAIAILENMNLQAVRMATEINELEESVSSKVYSRQKPGSNP